MLYWLPNAGAAAARMYAESLDMLDASTELPCGVSLFLHDIGVAPRAWAERTHKNLVYWNVLDRGGHFAAFEQPGIFVDEVRRFFRTLR